MGLSDAATDAVKALIPPRTNDLDAQQRWRWFVFAGIIGLALSLGIHIALACGYIPMFFAGFASSQDTKNIQTRVDVIASISLEREMRFKAGELCLTKDPKVKQILEDDISKLQREYYDIEKRYYPIPSCRDL